MSGTPGRTLLGFQQQYQYTRPSSSKGRPTSRAAAPSGSQDATSSPVSTPAPIAPAPLPKATTSSPAADVSRAESAPSKAPSPPPIVAAPSPPPPPAAPPALATAPFSNAAVGEPGPQPVPQTTSSAEDPPSAPQTASLNIDKSSSPLNGEAASANTANTASPAPASQPSSTENDMGQAATVEPIKSPELVASVSSAAYDTPEVTPSRPVLVNYGSKRRMNSSDNVASVGAESQPGPSLSLSSQPAPPVSQPSEPTPAAPQPSQPTPPASSSHAARSSSMSASSSSLGLHSDTASEKNAAVEASPLASLRDDANASTVSIRSNDSASTSLRRSRRGYDGEADPAALGPTQPRDLLAAATAATTSSAEPEEDSYPDQPTPLSFLDEYSATPSPKARKRGVLLSPGGGRASRRFGSSAMSSGGESGSAHSRETSRSEAVAQAPAPPSAPSVVEDDAMSLAFHEAGSEADHHEAAAAEGEGEDFPRGAVIFETMSSDAHSASGVRTPRSAGSDGAESGKAAGSVDTQGQGSTTLVDDAFRASLLRGSQKEDERPAYDDSWLHGGESAEVKQRKVPSPPRVVDEEPRAPLSKAVENSDHDEAPESITRYGLSSRSPAARGSRRGYDYSSPPVEQPPSSSTPPPPPLPARRRVSATPSPQTPTATPSSSQPAESTRERNRLKRTRRDDWESHILKADWEELEVSRYLSLFGKDVHEVRSAGPLDPHNFTHSAFPSKLDWTTFDGDEPKFNAAGYYLACTTALLSYLSPTQMVDLQRGAKPAVEEEDSDEEDEDEEGEAAQLKQEFRLATLRASGQRLYYSALPLWESLGSRLRRTWRWESKWRSFLSLVAYTFLWWRGLLIASLIFSVIMLVLGLKSKPPPPDTLRDVLARQRRREEEERRAKVVQPVLTAAPPPRSQYSLVVEASQNYGLTLSFLASALADGHERAKNFALWRSPRATWRLLFWLSLSFFASLPLKPAHLIRVPGAVLGLLFFFLAPIVEHKPHWLGTEWSNPFDWIFAGVPNDAQYSMEVLRSRAQQGKPLVGDPALLMRPDEEPVSATVEDETTGAVDWTRWADLVLRGKSMAIRGTEVLAGSRSLQLPRVPVGTIEPSTSRSSALLSHLSRGVNFGLEAIENRSKNSAAQQPSLMRERGQPQHMISTGLPPDEADVDGTFWALYDGCCGHVVITPQMVLFRSLFAKRPRGRRGLSLAAAPGSPAAVDDEQPLLDARGSLTIPESELSSSSSPPPKAKVLFQCKLDAVKGIKKLSPPVVRATRGGVVTGSTWSMAAGEGLRLVLKGRRGEVDFFQVRGRDEAFNRLLALAPQQWQRVN